MTDSAIDATTAPVPPEALHYVLDKAVSAIGAMQKLFYPEWELGGLRLGYWVPSKESDELGELISVTWGKITNEPDSFVGDASAGEQMADTPTLFPPLFTQYLHWLEQQCAQSLIDVTPPPNLTGRELVSLLYANFRHSQFEIGTVPIGRCRCKDPRTGRWYSCPCP